MYDFTHSSGQSKITIMHHFCDTQTMSDAFIDVSDAYMIVGPFDDIEVSRGKQSKTEIAQRRWEKLLRFTPDSQSYLINAFPKSGTHWMWNVMSMITKGSAEVTPLFKESMFLEMMPIERMPILSAYPYNCHFTPSQVPEPFSSLKTLIILRNPKDVMVSAYHHIHDFFNMPIHFDDFYKHWISLAKENPPNISDNFWHFTKEAWSRRHQPNILLLFYEDMIKEFAGGMRKLCKFMNRKVTDDFIEEVKTVTHIKSLREQKYLNASEKDKIFVLLYREGKIGEWKKYFSDEQSAECDRVTDEWLKDCHGLSFTYQ